MVKKRGEMGSNHHDVCGDSQMIRGTSLAEVRIVASKAAGVFKGKVIGGESKQTLESNSKGRAGMR